MNLSSSSCSMNALIPISPPEGAPNSTVALELDLQFPFSMQPNSQNSYHVNELNLLNCVEEKNSKKKQVYSREFQAMLDGLEEEDRLEEAGQATGKKKRLSVAQVKALEKIFEVETKVEPERTAKLADEIGLQPRQVAIWFQNRRARWKTKQLEKDYGVLKANYETLKLDYNNLQQENDALTSKLRDLKSKLKDENSEKMWENGDDHASSSLQVNGSFSSSDSSNQHQWIEPFETRMIGGDVYEVKVEEQCMITAEECCNFLSVDQAPSLQWYFMGQ